MPEGDTIRRLADDINRRFANALVLSSVFRHPRLATSNLSGSTLLQADAVGKHLLLRFSAGRTLHIHLRMKGRLFRRIPPGISADRRRLELTFSTGMLVGIDLPVMQLLQTKDEAAFTGHLGNDVCGAFDADAAVKRLSKAEALPISAALLDQRFIAGFGNIYAVETPFIVGINPFTPVSEIRHLRGLVHIATGLIRTNAQRGPQNTTGIRPNFTDQWVLNHRTAVCRWCGSKVERRSGRETPWRRRTAWCVECQPRDACHVDLNRAAAVLKRHPCRQLVDLATGEFKAAIDEPVVVSRSSFHRTG